MDFLRQEASTGAQQSRFSLDALLDFSALDKSVKTHLTRVYGAMAMASAVCCAGVLASLNGLVPSFLSGGLLGFLGVLGLTIALVTMEPSPSNQDKRMGLFMGIAALMGLNMAPLIQLVIHVNPQIIFTALLLTVTVFTCFTLAALLSGSGRQFLYLGGLLGSGLSLLLVTQLIGLFTGWKLALDASLYLGLLLMCGFVLFDTQMIVVKRRAGDKDYIKHALDLFIDAVSLFKHIVIILMNKDDNRRKRRN